MVIRDEFDSKGSSGEWVARLGNRDEYRRLVEVLFSEHFLGSVANLLKRVSGEACGVANAAKQVSQESLGYRWSSY